MDLQERQDARAMAFILKALGHEHRLELFLEIARQQEARFPAQGCCMISEIKDRFRIGAPTLSHHLRELAMAGLITTEKQGKNLVARINGETLQQIRDFLPRLKA
jgi:DNA-binding transcriptional ArsR family regulator